MPLPGEPLSLSQERAGYGVNSGFGSVSSVLQMLQSAGGTGECRRSLISDKCSTVWFMAYAHDSLYDFTSQSLAGTRLT
jgi:hypothetical protein